MKKLNIAELLKDCPTGMELDCTMYDNVQFDTVQDENVYPIKINTPDGRISLTKHGCYSGNPHGKCVIFPKGKTTWEGFKRPFKDGDVVITKDATQIFIFKENAKYNRYYRGMCYFGVDLKDGNMFKEGFWNFTRFATEEEKQKLFKAIKDNGYKWNPDTKTLEKLIEPKFKVGDKVKRKDDNYTYIVTIAKLDGDYYDYVNEDGQCGVIHISTQDAWELVPNKFDITTLKPFESKVLVCDYNNRIWIPTFWGKKLEDDYNYSYLTTNGCYKYCIPYENNEHLLGTTNDCDDFYKTWE